MSFEKVVIQKKLGDGSYIEDYPRTSQEMILNLLNSSTKSLMGLEESATADDAFKQLYLANVLNGKSMVELTFLDSETNKSLYGVVVSCDKFCDAAGTALTEHTTDNNGKIIAFVSAINPIIKISGYADIEDFNSTLTDVQALGKQYNFTFQLSTNLTKRYITSSSLKFSGNVNSVGFTLVGGGGAGDIGQTYSQYSSGDYGGKGGGHGGSGGQVVTINSFSFNANTIYSVTIGAGGTKRESKGNYPGQYTGGTSGGNSIFSRTQALGGNFAGANNAGINMEAYYNRQNKGGKGADGTQRIDYQYSSLKYGASGGRRSYAEIGNYLHYNAPGGVSGGGQRGDAGHERVGGDGTNGTGSGGGGAGACYDDDDHDPTWYLGASGSGRSGCIAFVFSLKSRS